MKKTLIFIIIVNLMVMAGCAKKLKKEERGLVEQQSAPIRFSGYKLAVKINASPEQVEQYLLDPKNFEIEAGRAKMKVISGKKFEKLGESADLRIEVLGAATPAKLFLVYREPKEAIYYILQTEKMGFSIWRFNLKAQAGGTRLTVKEESEDVGPMTEIKESMKIGESLAKMVDAKIAKAEVHFDPSLDFQELTSGGLRGELSESFYQGIDSSVWINAAPEKVGQYITDSSNWSVLKEKYGVDFGTCMLSGKTDPCPIRITIVGMEYEYNNFQTSYKVGEYSSSYMVSYMVSKQLISGVQFAIKPEQNGTRMSFTILMELPASMSQEGGKMAMDIMQIPKMIEDVLLDVKKRVEGAG